jgi:hypothetical protein
MKNDSCYEKGGRHFLPVAEGDTAPAKGRGLQTKGACHLFLAALFLLPVGAAAADLQYLVKDGQPRARIVIAEKPARTVKIAAEELQLHLQKMSGAMLPIVFAAEPDPALPVTVYVGKSPGTDRLGIDDKGLEDGAFRIKSGDGWIAFVGHDADFEPKKPFTMQPVRTHPDALRAQAEWDALSGGTYGNPFGMPSRQYSRSTGLWSYDERGSLNAVYEYLRRQGVRWYMPGDLGEIVPQARDIGFGPTDEVVRPAFTLRAMTPLSSVYSGLYDKDDLFWQLRLGLNDHCGALGVPPHISHGLAEVLERPEMRQKHPEYYALIGGKRDTARLHACLSAPGLVEEAAKFARALYDVYDAKTASIMPEDGFIPCECDACKPQYTLDRGRVGQYSDYVWAFVDKVARQVEKTHPDRTVNCFAYGTFTLPPLKIATFSPAVQVGIVHGRGWNFPQPTERGLEQQLPDLRRDWLTKTSRPLVGWEHYPFTYRGTFLPIYFPTAIAAGLKAQQGTALGDYIEVSFGPLDRRGHGLHEPAFNHLNIYVTSRMFWDPQQDLDTLLDEYCRLFYGPAAAEMREFLRYCEAHWQEMRTEAKATAEALKLFDTAKAKAPADSPSAARLAALDAYLVTLRQTGDQMARHRGDGPELKVRWLSPAEASFPLDGSIDKPVWGPYIAQYRTAGLVDVATGKPGRARTSFAALWSGDSSKGTLHVAIACEDPDMTEATAAALEKAREKAGQPAGEKAGAKPTGPGGDRVELLIETPAHSFYQLVIGPTGLVEDADWQGGKRDPQWDAQAQVATKIGKGFWTAEVRIPVPGADQLGDPLHEIAGRPPRAELPWYVNVIRERKGKGKAERATWVPAGSGALRDPRTFGKWYIQ